MTEGNFVDYVKINVSSGNGGKGSAHFRREKYITKGVRMVEMVVEEVMLFLFLISLYGLFIISNFKNISNVVMEVMGQKIEVLEQMEKM